CYANHAISPAKKDGKYGLIDKQGNWVMEPKFQWIGCFKRGLALVRDNLKEGIIDESGAYVLKPIFDKIDFITDTTPEIIGVEKDKKHGFIDRNGQWIIEPKFKRLRFFTPDGIAVASEDGKRYGLINRDAEWVVEPKFDEINPFSDGIAEAKVDDKWGYIDTKDHWVITPKKLYIIK
ncbi:MAG: WG repeat-containing protein, partial [Epsilonproteobacteria bacterium]|nr:WG repeat-containing protein [Campylobacterota bacterium]